MKLPADPTEKRSEHIKGYVEPSVKTMIEKYETDYAAGSFSSALRDVVIAGLHSIYG